MTRIAPDTRSLARALRRSPTPQERLLWMKLREINRMFGTHFRRRAPVGRFAADCADYGRKLVIAVDGSGHATGAGVMSDSVRDDRMAAQGFAVLRFWNNAVADNRGGVMQVILDAAVARLAAAGAGDDP